MSVRHLPVHHEISISTRVDTTNGILMGKSWVEPVDAWVSAWRVARSTSQKPYHSAPITDISVDGIRMIKLSFTLLADISDIPKTWLSNDIPPTRLTSFIRRSIILILPECDDDVYRSSLPIFVPYFIHPFGSRCSQICSIDFIFSCYIVILRYFFFLFF